MIVASLRLFQVSYSSEISGYHAIDNAMIIMRAGGAWNVGPGRPSPAHPAPGGHGRGRGPGFQAHWQVRHGRAPEFAGRAHDPPVDIR